MLQFRFQWKWGHPKKNSLYFTFVVVWDLLFSANEQNMWMKHDETKCLSSSYKTTGTIQQAYHSRALWYSDTLANTTTTTSPACEETRASKTNWCQTSHWQPAANARSKEVKGQLYNEKNMNANTYALISSKLPGTCTHQSIYPLLQVYSLKINTINLACAHVEWPLTQEHERPPTVIRAHLFGA